jgi:hypothetical protein
MLSTPPPRVALAIGQTIESSFLGPFQANKLALLAIRHSRIALYSGGCQMGFIVSALLALSSADPALPARVTHYGRLAEGWTRSRFIRPGMTFDEVRRIMGREAGSVGGFSWDLFYRRLGVMVTINFANDIKGEVVGVNWHLDPTRR